LGQPHATFLWTSEEERMRKNLVVFVVAFCVAAAAGVVSSRKASAAPPASAVHQAELDAAEGVNLRLFTIDGGVRGIYCFPTRNYLGSIQCDRNVHMAYGTKLIDGGSHGDDGGEPLAAMNVDDMFTFPEMAAKIDLPSDKQCAAFVFDDADAGTCTFYRRTP
jgi:hypothetical protein